VLILQRPEQVSSVRPQPSARAAACGTTRARRAARCPAAFQCETQAVEVERSLACETLCSGPNRSIERAAAVRTCGGDATSLVLAAAIWPWGTLWLVPYTASQLGVPRGIRITQAWGCCARSRFGRPR